MQKCGLPKLKSHIIIKREVNLMEAVMSKPEMIEALNPDPNKQGTRVTKSTYDAYRTAMLKAIPDDDVGIYFQDLSGAVEQHVSPELLENTSVGWWTTVLKLDLEARGVIERIPGKGKQRVRKVS